MRIILASQSPRRRELLKLLQLEFITITSNADETIDESLTPSEIAVSLAILKADIVKERYPKDLVLAADTIVVAGNEILGKPEDEEGAKRMLKLLSGKTHQVMTGVCIAAQGKTETFCSITDVTFCKLTDEEIDEYIATNEPYDKAGAYGIQGYASKFITSINGDYFTVMGLPLAELYQRLKKYEIKESL